MTTIKFIFQVDNIKFKIKPSSKLFKISVVGSILVNIVIFFVAVCKIL